MCRAPAGIVPSSALRARGAEMRRTNWICGVVAAGIAANAWAGEPRGPALGNVRYAASIDGAADADEFVGPLIAGEVLRIRVSVPRGSALVPRLEVLDPSGALVQAGEPTASP